MVIKFYGATICGAHRYTLGKIGKKIAFETNCDKKGMKDGTNGEINELVRKKGMNKTNDRTKN